MSDERPWAGRGKPWGAPAVIIGLSVLSVAIAAVAVAVLGAISH